MDTVRKAVGENKTIGFDFSPEGALIGGATVAALHTLTVEPTVGAPTNSAPTINTSPFYDSDGTTIPAHKGIVTRLTGGTVGTYTYSCLADTTDGDRLMVQCRVVVY